MMLVAGIFESVSVFNQGKYFDERVLVNRIKLENLNLIIRDLSELQS